MSTGFRRSALVFFVSSCLIIGTRAKEVVEQPITAGQASHLPAKICVWGGGEVPDAIFNEFLKNAPAGRIFVATDEKGERRINDLGKNASRSNASPLHFVSASEHEKLADELASSNAAWIDLAALPEFEQPIKHLLVSESFANGSPSQETLAKLEQQPGLVGVGVSPGTALVIQGRQLSVAGAGTVCFCLPASATRPEQRPVKLLRLRSGDKADLVALSRAAAARRGPAFPPIDPPVPNLLSGALFPCGGGDLPDSVWQRFITLAGGTNAPIVVLPIATPNPDDPTPKGIERLKAFGCKNVTVLSQRTKQEVKSPEFVRALENAKGVWFAGGRQWKYIDAYEGTIAEELFRKVLQRGGVIGGSSAGAAVQAQYMVRGNPLGNRDIMAEGYERGLNFLPGVAIDIHVAERNRLGDLIELIHTYPQLLGIGLDENTAAEIHGSMIEVLGSGHVAIVNPNASNSVTLNAGDKYDLAKQSKIK